MLYYIWSIDNVTPGSQLSCQALRYLTCQNSWCDIDVPSLATIMVCARPSRNDVPWKTLKEWMKIDDFPLLTSDFFNLLLLPRAFSLRILMFASKGLSIACNSIWKGLLDISALIAYEVFLRRTLGGRWRKNFFTFHPKYEYQISSRNYRRAFEQ